MKPDENISRKAACDKLKALFDVGTFAEFGELVTRPGTDAQEGVICGCGAVEGKLVYAFYEDFSSMKGAVDTGNLKKINNLYTLAEKNGAPVVSFLNSAGACVREGNELLSAYGELFANAARMSGTVLQISVVNGICTGSQAVYASMNDFVVLCGKESKFSFAPASVLKTAGAETTNSGASIVAADEAEAVSTVKKLIAILPGNCDEEVEGSADDVNRTITVADTDSSAEIAAKIADFGALTELYSCACGCVRTFIGTVNGKACGFVCACGEVGASGLNKASSLVRFCDSFSIPVLTFVDSAGSCAENEAKGNNVSAAFAQFASVVANTTSSKLALICGKAYGAAFTVFASKSLYDVTYALNGSVISVMSPESAVEFLKNDVLAASSDPEATRAQLIDEWKNNEGSPEAAAAKGLIDAVVSPENAVKYVAFGIEMMASKRVAPSPKKHASK